MDGDVARRAVVRGRVQGVGFRASTREQARRLGLGGWVRNEPDGTVTIHAEGPEDAVARLVSWIGSGPRAAVVVGVAVSDTDPAGHDSFTIGS